MRKTRKILAALLAMVMAMSIFCLTAVGGPPAPDYHVSRHGPEPDGQPRQTRCSERHLSGRFSLPFPNNRVQFVRRRPNNALESLKRHCLAIFAHGSFTNVY